MAVPTRTVDLSGASTESTDVSALCVTRGGDPGGLGTAAATVFSSDALFTGFDTQPSMPTCAEQT